MSNNSYPCRQGGEIGRAQVAQAEACGLEPEPAMNPILLKPNGDGSSQVIVNGRVWKTLPAREYYEHAERAADACARRVRRPRAPVRCHRDRRRRQRQRAEPARVRSVESRPGDRAFGAPWMLVADIERGGVFASVIGTVGAADARRSARCSAASPSTSSAATCRCSTTACASSKSGPASRCFGVFPYADDMRLDAEDSLALQTAADDGRRRPARASPSSDFRASRTRPISGC